MKFVVPDGWQRDLVEFSISYKNGDLAFHGRGHYN